MTNYISLLKHPKWFEKRKQILLRDNSKCLLCGNGERLQVHHRQYQFKIKSGMFELPWMYSAKYLITLCNNCHSKGHLKFKIPIIKLNK